MTEVSSVAECLHGIGDPMWCSICRTALGFQAGVDQHNNDCTVQTIVNLTGASYSEALELLEVAGRRAGKGAYAEQVIEALASVGFIATPSSVRLEVAIGSSGTFFVSARRGKRGHAFAIVAGKAINAGKFSGPGTSYRIFKVA